MKSKTISPIIFLFFLFVSIKACNIPKELIPAYENLRDAVYQNYSIEEIRNSFYIVDSLCNKLIKNSQQRAYCIARFEYLIGRAENEQKNWKEAEKHLLNGIRAIEQHIKKCSCDEAWRVKSALMGQLCLVKIRTMDYVWVIKHGLDVSKLANTAIKLQPHNGKAHILIASTLVYPPIIYGGNPRKGAEVMSKALTMPDIEKDDQFNIYSGLGIAYGRLQQRELALAYLEKALELYPNNKYVLEISKQIVSGQNVTP
jgi:tetratricopeptide (TPR) repeat protein